MNRRPGFVCRSVKVPANSCAIRRLCCPVRRLLDQHWGKYSTSRQGMVISLRWAALCVAISLAVGLGCLAFGCCSAPAVNDGCCCGPLRRRGRRPGVRQRPTLAAVSPAVRRTNLVDARCAGRIAEAAASLLVHRSTPLYVAADGLRCGSSSLPCTSNTSPERRDCTPPPRPNRTRSAHTRRAEDQPRCREPGAVTAQPLCH